MHNSQPGYQTENTQNFPFEISILIPAYNEENRIQKTILSIVKYLEQSKIKGEIICINDGSTDKTQAIVEKLSSQIPKLSCLNYFPNHGKGYALKQGVLHSKGEYILFTDADNSVPIEELEIFLQIIKQQKLDFVIGSRYLKDKNKQNNQPLFRTIISRIGNIFFSSLLISGIKDSQCGFKLFRNNSAKEIFHHHTIDKFAFDMEILIIAQSLNFHFKEIAVDYHHHHQSHIKPFHDSLTVLKDLIKIKINHLKGRYSPK